MNPKSIDNRILSSMMFIYNLDGSKVIRETISGGNVLRESEQTVLTIPKHSFDEYFGVMLSYSNQSEECSYGSGYVIHDGNT